MKYLNLILTVIAVVLVGVGLKLYLLDNSLKGFSDSCQLIVGSNQALINADARLEEEIANLRKEVAGVKDSLPKR